MVTNNSANYEPTQYNVQTGGTLGTLNDVAPSATTGVPLVSQGAASQPLFGTAVVAGGGTGVTSTTAYAVLCGGTTSTNPLQSIASVGSAGEILTSNGAGALPTFQAVSASGAITSITGNSGGAEVPLAGNFNILGTGSITVAGSANTETVQLTGLTNHNILVGAGSATITNVAPSATSGVPLISNGAAADPSFGTAVVAGGGTGRTTLTDHGVLVGAGTSAITQLAAGSAGQVLQSGGASADPAYSTATYPATATGTGTILRADGTNWVATTATYPTTTTVSQILYSSATNVVSGLATANNGTFITGTTGVPSVLANGTTGQILTATTGSPPSWASPASGSKVLISSQTASASSSISWTSGITSSYSYYQIIFYGVVLSNNAITVDLTVSTDGGSSYSATTYYQSGFQCTSNLSIGLGNFSGNNGPKWTVANSVSNSSTGCLNSDIKLFNLPSSSLNKNIMFSSIGQYSGAGESATTWGNGMWATTTAVNAIKLAPSAGTFSSGTFNLYGIV